MADQRGLRIAKRGPLSQALVLLRGERSGHGQQPKPQAVRSGDTLELPCFPSHRLLLSAVPPADLHETALPPKVGMCFPTT